MAPNSSTTTVVHSKSEDKNSRGINGQLNGKVSSGSEQMDAEDARLLEMGKNWNFLDHVRWMNVFWFVMLHAATVYGTYLIFTGQVKFLTLVFSVFVYTASLFGITAGVHRLWSHKAYKAKLPLRIILAICNSTAYQNSVYEWARDHRVHHKYTETNADPVNSLRGFFFSHCGWLMSKKHPDVKRIGGKVDLSDIWADPVVYYQHKFYIPSVIAFCFVMPTLVPWYFWGESLWIAYMVPVLSRYCLALNATWLVNSAAHMFGYQPYDVHMAPVENKSVAFLTLGEGWHNFHHAFPWDYSTSEWGWSLNFTTWALDQFAKIGWAYDFKKVSKEHIEARKKRTGPGSNLVEPRLEHEYMFHEKLQ